MKCKMALKEFDCYKSILSEKRLTVNKQLTVKDFFCKKSVHEGKNSFKCNICSASFTEKPLLISHILSDHEESPHDGGIPSCSKQDCENLTTHFCKTCEQNLCKFDIIKHYKNKLFNKDHEMIPI